jgi:hypothetical protein
MDTTVYGCFGKTISEQNLFIFSCSSIYSSVELVYELYGLTEEEIRIAED